jgi:UDP-N-acetylglucosamine acyltransferase
VQGGGVTRLGDDNWMMAYTHLAHDCLVGNNTIFANNAQLAGHVMVGDWVILGGFTAVHQFVRIGAHGMTGLGSVLLADQPPFVMSEGQPAKARSMNFEGLRRRGFTPERIAAVKAMHKALYRDGLTLEQARGQIAALPGRFPTARDDILLMLDFLAAAGDRGIVR